MNEYIDHVEKTGRLLNLEKGSNHLLPSSKQQIYTQTGEIEYLRVLERPTSRSWRGRGRGADAVGAGDELHLDGARRTGEMRRSWELSWDGKGWDGAG